MGNRICGPGAVLPDGSLAIPGDYTAVHPDGSPAWPTGEPGAPPRSTTSITPTPTWRNPLRRTAPNVRGRERNTMKITMKAVAVTGLTSGALLLAPAGMAFADSSGSGAPGAPGVSIPTSRRQQQCQQQPAGTLARSATV